MAFVEKLRSSAITRSEHEPVLSILGSASILKMVHLRASDKFGWTKAKQKRHIVSMILAAIALFSAFGVQPAMEAEKHSIDPTANRHVHIEISRSSQFRSEPPKRRYEVTAPIGKGARKGLPKIHGPADSRLPLVVLDAGHGGHDPGAISPHSGKREKDVTLAIAQAIRDQLVTTGRVRVALTRDGDGFLVLQDRYGIARRMKADLFISIHADAAENQEARGGTVYTLSEVASDREAQRLAARENKADIINGVNLGGQDSEVSSILIDLTQRETMNVSASFAKLLLREASPNMVLRGNSHKFASFIVLKAPDTPSILFETGYISNPEDAEFLASRDGQAKIARSVSSAVQAHFARRLARN